MDKLLFEGVTGGLLDIVIELDKATNGSLPLPYLISQEGFAVFMGRNDTTFNE